MTQTLQGESSAIAVEGLEQLSGVISSPTQPLGPVTAEPIVEAAALAMPHGEHAGLTLMRQIT
ncbi:hypothetical protein [Knoellia aerolata]|uniref:Uncharacterized protein n=1 Tax=Knoellia aerolata DSM 18566 TaxID=1385519 RepID=A0A0A0JQG2_9MICO|nr:hypothetical protein [Knoellia aerolata]KGN39710.1 hypothetical protein N801_19545 [Knoellia aerolata DSM 18566]